jgi:5-methylcytosine-specific restriction endonuclease McrA
MPQFDKLNTYIVLYGDELAARDGGWFCHYCGNAIARDKHLKPENRAAVDHKKSRRLGGTDDLDNLVLCCARCNNKKGSLKSAESFKAVNNG